MEPDKAPHAGETNFLRAKAGNVAGRDAGHFVQVASKKLEIPRGAPAENAAAR